MFRNFYRSIIFLLSSIYLIGCSDSSSEDKLTISGVVKNFSDSNPIAGVEISLDEDPSIVTFSSNSGGYQLNCEVEGEYHINYKRDGYISGVKEVTLDKSLYNINILLIPDSIFVVTNPQPLDGSEISDVRYSFSWNRLDLAVEYRFQIYDNEELEGEPLFQEVLTDTIIEPEYTFNNLATYYWKVNGRRDNSDWNSNNFVWSFSVKLDRPYSPTPVAGAVSNYSKPTLSWETPFEAINSELILAKDFNFEDIIFNTDTISSNLCYINHLLSDSTTYYWKVRSKNSFGVYSEFSNIWDFNMIIEPPSNPTPVDGKVIFYQNLTLKWDQLEYVDRYLLEVDTLESFDSPFLVEKDLGSNQYLIPFNFENNRDYYWRVRVKDRNGIISSWGETWSFTMKELTPISGYINEELTLSYQNTPYYIENDLFITKEGVVNIEAGVEIFCKKNIAFVVDGKLIAEGDLDNPITITGMPNSSDGWRGINFTPISSPLVVDNSGNYIDGSILRGVVVERGGVITGSAITIDQVGAYLDSVVIKDSFGNGLKIDIESEDRYFVNNSTITNSRGDGISYNGFEGSSLYLNGTIVNSSDKIGVKCSNGSYYFNQLELSSNNLGGIAIKTDLEVSLKGSNILGNSSVGVDIEANRVRLEDNLISGNSGLDVGGAMIRQFDNPTTLLIKGNIFSNNIGEQYSALYTVWNGINGRYTVRDNQLMGNNSSKGAIYCRGNSFSGSYILDNDIYDNLATSISGTALSLVESWDSGNMATLPLVRGNNFKNSDMRFELKNLNRSSSDPVNAQNNFWGSDTLSIVETKIYDNRVNSNYGVVNITPIKTVWIER